MSESLQPNEVDAQTVVAVLQRRLAEAVQANVMLEASLMEAQARLRATSSDSMEIQRLRLRVEELEAAAALPREA